uniref:Peroxisomal carnitine O-octanoyltransferase n=2 Tax=Eptatretus burgeri TaxID=7764 RepID=A0A8C4NM81_EPTBU
MMQQMVKSGRDRAVYNAGCGTSLCFVFVLCRLFTAHDVADGTHIAQSGMDLYTFESERERTFQYQESLPSLPVPPLHETLNKYLDSVKPLVEEEEYRRTQEVVRNFEYGEGRALQEKLLQRASCRRNWLEQWWRNAAYLDTRSETQISVNAGGCGPHLEHSWQAQDGTQVARCSILLWHFLHFWKLIRTEKLAVGRSGKTPLDMDQFRMLCCTCKIPGHHRDTLVSHFRTEREGHCPSHVVVLCRGRAFTFDTLDPNGAILTPPELARQLQNIKDKCQDEADGPTISALTSDERTRWAQVRDHLLTLSPQNATSLHIIESSLIVVGLDDASPEASVDDCSQLQSLSLIGDLRCRWGDKSFNLMAFQNGLFGACCDHAPYDAMVLVLCIYFIDQEIRKSNGIWQGILPERKLTLPEELSFVVDEKVLAAVDCAKENYKQKGNDLNLISRPFMGFGKELIKKCRIHPDTFVQLAVQLAYFSQHGKPGCCYETASTRRYFHGRTETMRSCTPEVVAWCRAMRNPMAVVQHKRELMWQAIEKHNQSMRECQMNRGCDRHLLGLLLTANEEGLPTPELYRDPSFSKSGGGGNFVLSTSLGGYTTTMGGVVAPMVHNGYGCFYSINSQKIFINVSTWDSNPETNGEGFFEALSSALHETMNLALMARL